MPAPDKIDLYKLHKADYIAPKKPALVDLKPACYLTIRGQGKPGGEVFQAHIGALYGMAFTVKMTRKFAGQPDYVVGKLESQWFFDGDPAALPPDQWRWRLLIRTPDFVTAADLKQAVATLQRRGKAGEAGLVRLETVSEGLCVQMLHLGPYDREPDTIEVMKDFAAGRGFRLSGPHHEIYLSDPRRVLPAKLKTILRQPVQAL